MGQYLNYLLVAVLLAVTLALLMGLANMMRGGSPNLSQKLMRWRVVLQLLAIIFIMGALFLRR